MIASFDGSRYLSWVAHHKQDYGPYLMLLQHLDPQGQHAAKSRVLDGPQNIAGKIPGNDFPNGRGSFLRRLAFAPPIRKRANIVPSRPETTQQTLMQRDHVLMFPISLRIVAAGRKQPFAERHTKLAHQAGQSGRAASVHADNQDCGWRWGGHQPMFTSGIPSSRSTNPVASRVRDGMTRNITTSIRRSTYSSPSPIAARTPAFRK